MHCELCRYKLNDNVYQPVTGLCGHTICFKCANINLEKKGKNPMVPCPLPFCEQYLAFHRTQHKVSFTVMRWMEKREQAEALLESSFKTIYIEHIRLMEKLELEKGKTQARHQVAMQQKDDRIKWLEHRMELMQRYIDGLDQELDSPGRSQKEEQELRKTLWSWEQSEKEERKATGRRFKLPRVSLGSKKDDIPSSSDSDSSDSSDKEFEFVG